MASLSFYLNTQVRLLDAAGRILADSGPPQANRKVSLVDKSDPEASTYAREISIARTGNSTFSSWLFSIQPGVHMHGHVGGIGHNNKVHLLPGRHNLNLFNPAKPQGK